MLMRVSIHLPSALFFHPRVVSKRRLYQSVWHGLYMQTLLTNTPGILNLGAADYAHGLNLKLKRYEVWIEQFLNDKMLIRDTQGCLTFPDFVLDVQIDDEYALPSSDWRSGLPTAPPASLSVHRRMEMPATAIAGPVPGAQRTQESREIDRMAREALEDYQDIVSPPSQRGNDLHQPVQPENQGSSQIQNVTERARLVTNRLAGVTLSPNVPPDTSPSPARSATVTETESNRIVTVTTPEGANGNDLDFVFFEKGKAEQRNGEDEPLIEWKKTNLKLAKMSAEVVGDDDRSLGFHIIVWNHARTWDNRRGNTMLVDGLLHLLSNLETERKRLGGKPQGKTWTRRVKRWFDEKNAPLLERTNEANLDPNELADVRAALAHLDQPDA